MQNAEMEIIAFDAQDIIATSGKRTFLLDGLYDDEKGNVSFVDSNGTFRFIDYAGSSMAEIFEEKTLGDLTVSLDTKFKSLDGNREITAGNIFSGDADNSAEDASRWNGVYQWVVENSGYFQRIQ